MIGLPAWIRRVLRWARRLAVGATLGSIALGVVGQVVRDPSAAWALLMYLPLPLIGLGAIVLDLACGGRGVVVAGRRFGLLALGLVVAVGSSARLVAWAGGPVGQALATKPEPGDLGPPVTLLHWNVIWGGGYERSQANWAAIRRTIAAAQADLIVLSEAPPDNWLAEVAADLGPLGHWVGIAHEPGEPYWFRLAVASRRPLRLVRREVVRNGVAMIVEAQVRPGLGGGRGEFVRLLVVDGRSRPTQWRTPFLDDVAAICERATGAGTPIDLVVGDFNCVSQSRGFARLAEGGYRLAAAATPGQWRGTFPSFAPLYDIDHVWVAPRLARGLACRLFTALASDHRGQVVTLHLPEPPPSRSRAPWVPMP